MTRLNAHAPALFVLLLAACQKTHTPPAFDYTSDLGVAVDKVDGVCLDIPNGALSAGQRIQFVTSSTPQTTGELEIAVKVDQACTPIDQNKRELHHYRFKVVRGSLEKGAPAFAIANFGGTLIAARDGVTGDLDRDGQPESFRSCTSLEGLHLTVWTGKPLEGRRRWHYYYYLGYDVEANCTDADTKPDTP